MDSRRLLGSVRCLPAAGFPFYTGFSCWFDKLLNLWNLERSYNKQERVAGKLKSFESNFSHYFDLSCGNKLNSFLVVTVFSFLETWAVAFNLISIVSLLICSKIVTYLYSFVVLVTMQLCYLPVSLRSLNRQCFISCINLRYWVTNSFLYHLPSYVLSQGYVHLSLVKKHSQLKLY